MIETCFEILLNLSLFSFYFFHETEWQQKEEEKSNKRKM
jgi:hypothetical protein